MRERWGEEGEEEQWEGGTGCCLLAEDTIV